MDDALRDCARQLSATRQTTSALADRGDLTERRAAEALAVLRSSSAEIRDAHREVSACVEEIESMRDAWVATDTAGVPVVSVAAEK